MMHNSTGGCYHVWVFNHQGNALFRRRRCYSRSAANQFVVRGLPGIQVMADTKPAVVLQCQEVCPCQSKCPHVGGRHRPTTAEKLERRGQMRADFA